MDGGYKFKDFDSTWADPVKLFTAVIYDRNKLECLSLAILGSLVYYLQVRTGAYPRVEHPKDWPVDLFSLQVAPSIYFPPLFLSLIH